MWLPTCVFPWNRCWRRNTGTELLLSACHPLHPKVQGTDSGFCNFTFITGLALPGHPANPAPRSSRLEAVPRSWGLDAATALAIWSLEQGPKGTAGWELLFACLVPLLGVQKDNVALSPVWLIAAYRPAPSESSLPPSLLYFSSG